MHVISSHSIPSNMLKILILRLFSYCSFLFFRYEIFDSDWLFLVGVCLHMKFVHFDVKVVFLKSQVSGLQKISVGQEPEHISFKLNHVTTLCNLLPRLVPLPPGKVCHLHKWRSLHSMAWYTVVPLETCHRPLHLLPSPHKPWASTHVPAHWAHFAYLVPPHLTPRSMYDPTLKELTIWLRKQRFWVHVHHMKISKPLSCYVKQ